MFVTLKTQFFEVYKSEMFYIFKCFFRKATVNSMTTMRRVEGAEFISDGVGRVDGVTKFVSDGEGLGGLDGRAHHFLCIFPKARRITV